jgi:hypothetical protein
MMWSLFVVLISFFARGVPGLTWVMIGALIVFATAFLLSRRGGAVRGTYGEKRWRGQPLDLSSEPLPDRLKAWIKGKRRRP